MAFGFDLAEGDLKRSAEENAATPVFTGGHVSRCGRTSLCLKRVTVGLSCVIGCGIDVAEVSVNASSFGIVFVVGIVKSGGDSACGAMTVVRRGTCTMYR